MRIVVVEILEFTLRATIQYAGRTHPASFGSTPLKRGIEKFSS